MQQWIGHSDNKIKYEQKVVQQKITFFRKFSEYCLDRKHKTKMLVTYTSQSFSIQLVSGCAIRIVHNKYQATFQCSSQLIVQFYIAKISNYLKYMQNVVEYLQAELCRYYKIHKCSHTLHIVQILANIILTDAIYKNTENYSKTHHIHVYIHTVIR